MNRVVLVHGINTSGKNSIFNLSTYLKRANFEVLEFQYNHNSLLDTFSKAKSRANAEKLKQEHRGGDHVVFHSNGARVVHQAMRLGARFSQAYAFAPAFNAKTVWPDRFDKMNVIHNPRDMALWQGFLIPRHEFGLLGVIGYQGVHDKRIHSISNWAGDTVDMYNHSQYWRDNTRLAKWANYLIERLV